ncbi:hypothetical protein Glove_108g44 [Diversispora epigaea]|uniref:Uncharacterized protein n=1 Tax=Diversispora epigaea TaxID=1348612 RepID=A0A397J774_9GLOM|nr:hypothetical protein Glove_108g44 [Diversispora epigaea]
MSSLGDICLERLKVLFLTRRVPDDDNFKKLLKEIYGNIKNEDLSDHLIVAHKKFNGFRYEFKKEVINLSKEFLKG